MTRQVQNGTARKRAMRESQNLLRESQNLPLRDVGSGRAHCEDVEHGKGRAKRECHRTDEAARSPTVLVVEKSIVHNGTLSQVEPVRLQSSDAELGNTNLFTPSNQKFAEVSPCGPSISPCEPFFPSEDAYSDLARQCTPSQFMNQKLRVELLERDLAVCSEEKVQLQKQLQASLQTAFKLQEVIMKQKMVIELEHVAAQQRSNQIEQYLLQRDELIQKLEEAIRLKDEAVRSKEEAELTLTLSRDLHARLFPGTEFADFFQKCEAHTGSMVSSKKSNGCQRDAEDGEMELLRQKLDETLVDSMIQQAVVECVYAGSLYESEVEREEDNYFIQCQANELRRMFQREAEREEEIHFLECEANELKRKLEEAVRLKEEAELTVSLSRDLNSRLFSVTENQEKAGYECGEEQSCSGVAVSSSRDLTSHLHSVTGKKDKADNRGVVQESYSDDALGMEKSAKEANDERITVLRQELDHAHVGAAVYQAVIESLYGGALQESEAKVTEVTHSRDHLAKKVEELNALVGTLQGKLTSCDVTVELPTFRRRPTVFEFEQDTLVLDEDLTPIKLKMDETPHRFVGRKVQTSQLSTCDNLDGSPWITTSTTLDFCVAARREATLKANLRKSVQELEILGDQVEEHKIILEKVTLLLSFISKSGYTANGTKELAREICDHLEDYEALR